MAVIKLIGEQACDYIMAKTSLSSAEKDAMKYVNNEPAWSAGTKLLAAFNDNLTGGNSETGISFSGWAIYRQNITDGGPLEFVAEINDISITGIRDYLVANQKEYRWYMYLNTDDSRLAPFESNIVETFWWDYTLITAEATNVKNRLRVKNIYHFGLNVETGPISNNTKVNLLENFTQYPKIQASSSNFRTSTLGALTGWVDTVLNEYKDSQDVIDKLRTLSTDNTRKFLKDRSGNIIEIKINGAIEFEVSDATREQLHRISIPWVEVGAIDGISLIVANDIYEWVLTRTGIPQIGTTYAWLENHVVRPGQIVTPNPEY